jgi:hypothetical protein
MKTYVHNQKTRQFNDSMIACYNVTASGLHFFLNRIGGVMFSVIASSAVDRGLEPKTIKLVFDASPLSTQQ